MNINTQQANNKRIAKNTLLLYFRMIITMIVTLFTSRIVLDTLGETNYGIYNVVGGVVTMFSVLSSSLSGAISRFITYELGKKNLENLKLIFSTSVNIQIIMSIIIFLLCEVIGGWFLNEKMNIPSERMEAANFILHCSIITFVINLISVPYNATIIAHERMNVFAYISILEVSLKLLVAYLIYLSPFDKLKIYALLILSISAILRFIYSFYCKHHFEEANYNCKLFDKRVFKEMFSFAGWNLFGNTAYMLNTQGINMLINIFFGVTTNAARAIVVQVDTAIQQFVNNFMTAINPQITKSYAIGDYEYMYKLVCRGTKFSFFIMYIFVVPIVLEAETILKIWLNQVPADTTIFMRLVVISSLASLIGNSLYCAIQSTGHIKRYQVIVTLVGCLVFPLTWIAYKLGAPAYSTYIIYAILYFSLNFIRLSTLKRLMNFKVEYFIYNIFAKIGICAIVCFIMPGMIAYCMPPSITRFLLVCFSSILWSVGCIYFIGFDKVERDYFTIKIKNILKRI